MPREITHYFTFPIPFEPLYLSECFFLCWNQTCFITKWFKCCSQRKFISTFPCHVYNFKTGILSSSLISRVLSQIPTFVSSFSWDMVFRCFTIFLSLLWMYSLCDFPLKTYHWNKNQSGKHDIEMIIIPCDLNAVFLSYNTKRKIESP